MLCDRKGVHRDLHVLTHSYLTRRSAVLLVDGGDDRLQRCVGILKIAAHGKGNFRLGLGVNDPRRIEHASVRNFHVREQRAEICLIDTELPADRISRNADLDRKSVVYGKSVSVRVNLGGSRDIQNKKIKKTKRTKKKN